MPKFLLKASYSPEGLTGVLKEGGTGRREAIRTLAESVGGSMEAFYYAYGETDAYVVCDLPDTTAATALSLTVNSSGAATVSTVPLFDPEEIDEAAKKAVEYRPPGG